LPAKIEDEFIHEAMRTLTNPAGPYYNRLMKALFARNMNPSTDFTYDYNSGNGQFDEVPNLLFSKCKVCFGFLTVRRRLI
jgi:translation initiation factor 2-alpha kinase 4